jgi:HK97 family phage portal protein
VFLKTLEASWTPQEQSKYEWFIRSGGGVQSNSGETITFDSALRIAAVYSAVRIISEALASLPLIVYRRLPGGGKERATDHWAFRLLHDKPNSIQTSFEWRETFMSHLLLRGNAYHLKLGRPERPTELIPFDPDLVDVELKTGRRLIYTVNPSQEDDGRVLELPQAKVFHLRGLSSDGYMGRSVISDARDAMGLSISLEKHGSGTFKNGVRPSGVLEVPVKLADDAYQRLKDSFNQEYGGSDNAGKTALLEQGTTFKPVSMTNEDSQFVDSRKFQIAEVARTFRLPLHMLQENVTQPRANMEQAALEFVQNTLRPWAVRIEQAIDTQILGGSEEFFVEHLFDGMLRGDQKSRFESYAIAKQNGWLNADEIRERENMNPLPDGQGEVYREQLNLAPVGEPVSEESDATSD